MQSIISVQSTNSPVSFEGLRCGPWIVEIQGPNIRIYHDNHPDLEILLDGDGFVFRPAVNEVIKMLGLPRSAGFQVQHAGPPISVEC
jgi:hypothetical protein